VIHVSTAQRVAKNSGIVIAGNVIFRLISLFVLIYLARYLGTSGFGKFSFTFAYLAFFGVITDLGLQTILVREMSRDPPNAPKLIGNGYVIRFILTMLAFVLSIVVISLMSYPTDTTTYIYIAAFTLLFISFSDFYATIFAANLRMEYNIVAKIVYRSLSAGLIIWIIFSHGTLAQILTVMVFSEIIKTVINYIPSRKFVRPRFEIDFGLWKHLLKESLPIALSSIILIIYIRTDIVMLSIMKGDVAVGYYSGASKLYETLILIPSAFMVSMFPIMSASFKNSKDRLIKSYRLSFRYLLIIILPIAIGTTLLADEFIFLLYGAEFAGSAFALQILIWALVFTSVNSVLLDLLTSINKQKLNTFSHTMCAIANVTLNFILIPILSYNGAAIATVVTTVVLFTASFYLVSKHLQVLPIHKIVIKPAIGGLIMGVFLCYFIDINTYLLVSLAGIVYLVALLALKTFSEEDIDIVKRVLSR
jgi:O-antigen/teichoic acid export membrane protein